MSDCRDYKEILLGESLDSNDSSSSDYEPSSETLGSQSSKDTWSDDSSQSSKDSSQSSDSSQDSQKDSV